MKLIDIRKIEPALDIEEVTGTRFYTRDELEAVNIRIVKGGHLKSHKTPVDCLFYVIRGKGEFEIGGDYVTLQRAQCVESPKDIPHAVTNVGDEELEFLVLKTPKP